MLMKRSQLEMASVFNADHVSLHVRKSNRAAFHLYTQTLKYDIHYIEKGYYADGEDAYDMRCYFKKSKKETSKDENENEDKIETNEKDVSAIEKGVQEIDLAAE